MSLFFHREYDRDGGYFYLEPVKDRPLPEARGWVYFVEMLDGPIKIGFSKDPFQRMRVLQTACSTPLSLICAIEAEQIQEKAFHQQLRKHRLQGEWFDRQAILTWLERRIAQNFN